MILHLREGEKIAQRDVLARLVAMQYTRNELDFRRGTFRVRGDVIDVFPAEHAEHAIRISLFDDEVEKLELFDPLTGRVLHPMARFTVYPSSHYVTPRETTLRAVEAIKAELRERIEFFQKAGHAGRGAAHRAAHALRPRDARRARLLQGHRELLAPPFRAAAPGEPPPTLIDYLPHDALMIIDESHVTIPQLGGMYKGDRSRKENLVEYGFRLPSALDNRPLRFDEFEAVVRQTVFVSATPADYERRKSAQVVEQVVRPTGLVDPQVDRAPGVHAGGRPALRDQPSA